MGLLYAIFSIFITLIFPKQITDVICYGKIKTITATGMTAAPVKSGS